MIERESIPPPGGFGCSDARVDSRGAQGQEANERRPIGEEWDGISGPLIADFDRGREEKQREGGWEKSRRLASDAPIQEESKRRDGSSVEEFRARAEQFEEVKQEMERQLAAFGEELQEAIAYHRREMEAMRADFQRQAEIRQQLFGPPDQNEHTEAVPNGDAGMGGGEFRAGSV
jgi:hypothetical protein